MNITHLNLNKYLRFSFLTVLLTILVSNTFSPQFLIWLAPFAACLSNLEAGLLVAASGLTWMYFRNWDDLVQLQPMATSLLILRNLILIILFLVSLRKYLRKGGEN